MAVSAAAAATAVAALLWSIERHAMTRPMRIRVGHVRHCHRLTRSLVSGVRLIEHWANVHSVAVSVCETDMLDCFLSFLMRDARSESLPAHGHHARG